MGEVLLPQNLIHITFRHNSGLVDFMKSDFELGISRIKKTHRLIPEIPNYSTLGEKLIVSRCKWYNLHTKVYLLIYITLGRCPLSIFISHGIPFNYLPESSSEIYNPKCSSGATKLEK